MIVIAGAARIPPGSLDRRRLALKAMAWRDGGAELGLHDRKPAACQALSAKPL